MAVASKSSDLDVLVIPSENLRQMTKHAHTATPRATQRNAHGEKKLY